MTATSGTPSTKAAKTKVCRKRRPRRALSIAPKNSVPLSRMRSITSWGDAPCNGEPLHYQVRGVALSPSTYSGVANEPFPTWVVHSYELHRVRLERFADIAVR